MGRRKNWLVAWHFPALGGSVQHSLSPVIADCGAMIKKGTLPDSGVRGQYCSHYQNFTNGDRVPQGWTGTVAAYEACLRTTGCHRPRRPMNSGLSIPRAGAVSSGFDCNVARSAAKVAAISGLANFHTWVPPVRLWQLGHRRFLTRAIVHCFPDGYRDGLADWRERSRTHDLVFLQQKHSFRE
jgi:hypothetical protein